MNSEIDSVTKTEIIKRLQNLEKENKKLKQKLKLENSEDQSNEEEHVSRRSFLKKLGIGAAGLGAASIMPSATAFDIKGDNFQVLTGTSKSDLNKYFSVNQGGPVEIQNTDLIVKNSTGQEILQVPVYQSTSDLPSKPEGSIAYVKDDKQLYVEDGS